MNKYKDLCIPSPTDLRFGVSPKPLTTRHGLTIGGGVVYPELNFALPTMFVQADRMPEVRQHYRQIITGACQRTADKTKFAAEDYDL